MALSLLVCVLVSLGSISLTWSVRRHALVTGMIDVPNARSSHVVPTPRGGGVAIAVSHTAGVCVLVGLGGYSVGVVAAILLGGVLVAAIGYLDDRRGLSALSRIAVHGISASVAVGVVASGYFAPDSKFLLSALLVCGIFVLGLVWCINLFNFMDGIDGIAASQAVFVSLASAWLAVAAGADVMWGGFSLMTAAASVGFLIWNWPPAKIFMGDVGSGFLGYWLAVLAIGLHVSGNLSIWTSVILGSVFIADATTTLLRRVVRGERWYEAHRTHAYQHLAQRWGSHLKVTGLVWGINLGAILPLAYASTVWPQAAFWIAAAALGGLSLGCLALGAGKPSPT